MHWKDYKFSLSGAGRPTGIALTACCYYLFSVQKAFNFIDNSYKYNDLQALYNVVDGVINAFGGCSRITVELPVQPGNNLFEKMTDNQMTTLKTQLITLRDTLVAASNESTIQLACAKLRFVFGNGCPES